MGKKTRTKAGEPSPTESKLVQMPDHSLDFPELYMSVYISETSEEVNFAPLFVRAQCCLSRDPLEADLVVFTGGPDVNPDLYGKKNDIHPMTRWDAERDNRDMQLFADCWMAGVPMLGICRGAQFLHVMNQGELYQHVDNHVGDHHITDTHEKVTIARVSSTHHQMVKRNNRMEILAVAAKSDERWLGLQDKEEGYHDDVEAFFYRETCCLGIQGHPEFGGYTAFANWTLRQIEHYIVSNPDIYIDSGRYRLKRDVTLLDGIESVDERVIR